MYDALEVSQYIIDYCREKKYCMSNLKLQKVLYYVQAEFLVVTKERQKRKNSVSGRTIVLLFLTVHHPRILQHQRKNQIIMSGYLGAAANITLMLVAAV